MSFYKFKRLAYSRWQRIVRWEFWPVWLFYIPIVFYIIALTIKYRSLTAFSIANPGMDFGGIFGDDKSTTLLPLSKHNPDAVPKTQYFNSYEDTELHKTLEQSENYPLVLKPNTGFRGTDVLIAKNIEQAHQYLQKTQQQTLIVQEYIKGKEFGVFYIKVPGETGFVYSIVEKTFPQIVGDGISNIEKLILENPRAALMAPMFLAKHKSKLDTVLNDEEPLQLVDVGSHCRGSLFLDANHLITKKLEDKLELLLQCIPEFYFGRLDLRCESEEKLKHGETLKILEINGVTSESAHIYDPKHSLMYAYKVMFKQWDWAFKIGIANKQRGYTPIGLLAIVKRWLFNKEKDR